MVEWMNLTIHTCMLTQLLQDPRLVMTLCLILWLVFFSPLRLMNHLSQLILKMNLQCESMKKNVQNELEIVPKLETS